MALFKKVSAATLALLISASAISVSAAGTNPVLLTSRIGDADNNGSVNTLDFVKMNEEILNATPDNIYNSDFNFDGVKDAADMVLLKKVLADKKLANAFNATTAYNAMYKAFTNAERSEVKSTNFKSTLDGDTVTFSSVFRRDGKKADLTIKKGAETEYMFVDANDTESIVLCKLIGEEKYEDVENATKDDVKTTVEDMIKATQGEGALKFGSLNVAKAFFETKLTSANFVNAYTYTDGTNYYMMVPVEDVVPADAKYFNTAGTYMIKMDEKFAPVSIEVVIGTSSTGASTIVEEGIVEFKLTGDELTKPENEQKIIDPFAPGDPVKDLTVAQMLKKSVQALSDIEYYTFSGTTEETAKNGKVEYSNTASLNGVKSGTDVDVKDISGTFTYDGDKYDYKSKAFIENFKVDGKASTADAYVNTTLTAGNASVETGYLYKSASDFNSLGSLKSELVPAGKTVYQNVIDKMVADKEAEVKDFINAKDEFEALVPDKDALEARKNALEKEKNSIENAKTKLDAQKADLEARADAATTQAEKDALESEKKDLEADYNALQDRVDAAKEDAEKLEADVNAFQNKIQAKLDKYGYKTFEEFQAAANAKKEELEAEQAKFEKFQTEAVAQIKEQSGLNIPSKSYLKDMISGNSSVSSRINNNSSIDTLKNNEDLIMLTVKAGAFKDEKGDYISGVTSDEKYRDTNEDVVIKFVVNKKENYRPERIEIVENTTVKANPETNNAEAVVKSTLIEFSYDTTNQKVLVKPTSVKNDPVNYVKTDKDFTKFVADVIADKVAKSMK